MHLFIFKFNDFTFSLQLNRFPLYVSHFHYRFNHGRTLGLLVFPCYCKYSVNEQLWANICGIVCQVFEHMPGSGRAGSHSRFILRFCKVSTLISSVGAPIYSPINNAEVLLFTPYIPSSIFYQFLDICLGLLEISKLFHCAFRWLLRILNIVWDIFSHFISLRSLYLDQ